MDFSQLQPVKTESDLKAEADRHEAIRYLTSTDWYVIRQIEVGTQVPDDIKEQRAAARLIITPQ